MKNCRLGRIKILHGVKGRRGLSGWHIRITRGSNIGCSPREPRSSDGVASSRPPQTPWRVARNLGVIIIEPI
jgi:hypothetical protein